MPTAPQPAAGSSHRPVITDEAALAGVSYATVSRVVNGHPSVRPATRVAVQAAIEALGWTPDPAAQALGSRRGRASP